MSDNKLNKKELLSLIDLVDLDNAEIAKMVGKTSNEALANVRTTTENLKDLELMLMVTIENLKKADPDGALINAVELKANMAAARKSLNLAENILIGF